MGPCIHPASAGAAEEHLRRVESEAFAFCSCFILWAGNMVFNSNPTFTTQLAQNSKIREMKDS
ncbi:hypothetical protein EMPG_12400 [Blastomyces silverae]|uniref:Uncharacterized protein n=1 Tax=Blastomyces silverae TaxID=2060906 RepID=A0A0H1BNI1_9EURO|nr:hypothetical protein EMPG_12400 [Blastomyces silverae]